MGVDAVMVAVVKQEQAEPKKLKRHCYDLFAAFGRKAIYLSDEYTRRALEVAPEYLKEDYSIKYASNEILIRVSLKGRYYGKGYERGPLPDYIMIAEWMERRFPGAVILYGGDSHNILKSFGASERAALMDYFCSFDHRPYYIGIQNSLDKMVPIDFSKRDCFFCKYPLQRYGFGPAYAAMRCDGCDFAEETRDSGITWKVRCKVGGRMIKEEANG